jgi:ABC-type lipoprotein release transport system permease subunit
VRKATAGPRIITLENFRAWAPLDPVTFGTIPVLLLLVAVGSVLIPAARASRVAPVEALRGE